MRSIMAVVVLAATIAAQDLPRPVFRSGVDLVTVDAIVLDAQGKPVTDLAAADFVVTAAGKVRKVVSAEFVPVAGTCDGGPAPADAGPIAEATSNTTLRESRSFLIVADVEQIDSGGGMGAMRSVTAFVGALRPDDRVGVVALPYGTPRVDLTTNRAVVKQALGHIVGAGQQRDNRMSVGEAVAIERNDRRTLQEWADRTNCGDPRLVSSGFDVPLTPDCVRTAQTLAQQVVRRERLHSRHLFDALSQLASAMAPIRGLKTIVLVSEGMLRDHDTRDALRRFAEAAAASRVTLYSLLLHTPATQASDGMARPPDRSLDIELNSGGMADTAIAAGGEMFQISGTADNALSRIDTQLAGYYLLSFQSDPGDAGGKRRTITVEVRRPGASVRARSDFAVPGAAASASATATLPKDLRARVGELIRWPVPIAEIAIDVATFVALPKADAQKRRVVIIGELPPNIRAAAAGYEISDEKGKTIADAFELDPATKASSTRTTYVTGIELAAGTYRLKLGLIAEDGRRGSIEHAFTVAASAATPVTFGDIFVGLEADERFHPLVRVQPDTPQIAVQIEVQATAGNLLEKLSVMLDVTRRGASSPLASAAMRIEKTPDPLTRVAAAMLTVARLEPGEYVLRATLPGSSPLQQVTRIIRKN